MGSVYNPLDYIKIRDSIETTWPEYKIKAANELIVSKHGIKLKSRRNKDGLESRMVIIDEFIK